MSHLEEDINIPLTEKLEKNDLNQPKEENTFIKIKNSLRMKIILGIIFLVIILLIIAVTILIIKLLSKSSGKKEEEEKEIGLEYEYEIEVKNGEEENGCYYPKQGQAVQIFGHSFNLNKYKRNGLEVEVDGEKIIDIDYLYKFTDKGIHKVKIKFKEEKLPQEDMLQLFYNLDQIKKLHFNRVNTEDMTSFSKLFFRMECLQEINLENFNSTKVTDMSGLFRSCHNIKELDISSFDTSQVTTMFEMFAHMYSVKNIKLNKDKFMTNKTIEMDYMFQNDKSLTNLDLTNANFDNVNNCFNMFNGNILLELTITKSQYEKIKETYSVLDAEVKKINIVG